MTQQEKTPVRSKPKDLQGLTEEELLSLRICDLPVGIPGTWLEECVAELYQELKAKQIILEPECYLADEWLTPTNEPVIGIPFFLAHPALLRLEKRMMLEAEGETREWCLKLLRHEAGHALCYAYQLQKKRKWKDVFGSPSQTYGETYKFRPYSKSYVRHLDGFYAQYHPDEDFCETFAVWLTPGLDWEKKYQGWQAIKKLRYVDELMRGLENKPPRTSKGTKYWQAGSLRSTLKNFYNKKLRLHEEDLPGFHDNNLSRIFVPRSDQNKDFPTAAEVIRHFRRPIVKDVSYWTGERRYVIENILKTVHKRCGQLKLVAVDPEPVVALRLTSYVTTLVMNYFYTGWFRGDKVKRKRK